MRNDKLETGSQKLDYIINELKRLKGLEFISKEEIAAMNYACKILDSHKHKLKDRTVKKSTQYITNCPVNSRCEKCYREIVCKNESLEIKK